MVLSVKKPVEIKPRSPITLKQISRLTTSRKQRDPRRERQLVKKQLLRLCEALDPEIPIPYTSFSYEEIIPLLDSLSNDMQYSSHEVYSHLRTARNMARRIVPKTSPSRYAHIDGYFSRSYFDVRHQQ